MRPLRFLWLGTVPYATAWGLQRRLATARAAGELDADAVLLLEHPPVFTMGRNGEPGHLRGGPERLRGLGAEYLEVDRGGSVTFHGPGQLVAYPIVRLAEVLPVPGHPGQGDVLRYVRALEEAMLATAAAVGVTAGLRPPYTGVWVGEEKLGAIGVKLSRGVTLHGLAINATTDLSWFAEVVPCGISDGGVTSLERLGASGWSPERLALDLARHLAAALGLVAVPADAGLRELAGTAAAA
ncbi:MAG TPA: lipoyl(octanoyl) transferase LipB [Candidatus Dormibacteraeota bacterium]|nr:lipoyl(octanoyl) transferase LipB [Candidatus Dormibacteraeota bacterium]